MSRLGLDISDEQHQALRELVPHGSLRLIFSVIIDDLIDLLSPHDLERRKIVLGALLSKDITLSDWSKTIKKELENDDR